MNLELTLAGLSEKPTVRHLYQFYCFDTSAHDGFDVEADGLYSMSDDYFGRYWTRPNWSARLIHVDGRIAGFLLVEPADVPGLDLPEFADFFIMPKYRRRGIGQRLVQQVIVDSGHPWVITVFNDDLAARAFWAAMFSRCGFGEPEQLTDPQGRDATVHVLRPPARAG